MDSTRRPKPTEAAQVLPPEKQFISEDVLDEVWEVRGMKYRIDDLHMAMLNHGLNVTIDRPRFRSTVLGILKAFLVEGQSRVDPKKAPVPRFPKVS